MKTRKESIYNKGQVAVHDASGATVSHVSKTTLKKWVKALRSGKYSQAQKQLQTDKGHCCLGVACDLFIPKSKQELHEYVGMEFPVLSGQEPCDQPNAPKWLREINREFKNRLLKKHQAQKALDAYGKFKSLVRLNDTGSTFLEIADQIEDVFELKEKA